MKNDSYFVLSVRYESPNESRFLFDFNYYSLHNQTTLSKLKGKGAAASKLDLWCHFLKHKDTVSYRFHLPTQESINHINFVINTKLSICPNHFDYQYYLDNNPDLKNTKDKSKSKNKIALWSHFLKCGIFEYRKFLFTHDMSVSQAEIDRKIYCALRPISTYKHNQKPSHIPKTHVPKPAKSNYQCHPTSSDTSHQHSCNIEPKIEPEPESDCKPSQTATECCDKFKTEIDNIRSELEKYEATIRTTIEASIDCRLDEIINAKIENIRGARNFQIDTQLEDRLTDHIRQIVDKNILNRSGTCYLQILGLGLRGIVLTYHQINDHMIINGFNQPYNLQLLSRNDIVELKFICGDDFKPVIKTVCGYFYLIINDKIINGIISYRLVDQAIIYILDNTLDAYQGQSQLFFHLEYQIEVI